MFGLRFFGFLIGFIFFVFVLRQRRKKREVRGSQLLPLLLSLGLMCVSAFPGMMTFPAALLSLNNVEFGRIVTIQLICILFLFLLFFWERAKSYKTKQTLKNIAISLGENSFHSSKEISPHSIWIVIPVLNEAKNLKELLPKIPPQICGVNVVTTIIDDGSTDNTLDVARMNGCSSASLPTNLGGGVALLTGFSLAQKNDGIAVITMDGDNQHDPSDLENLVMPIIEGDADLVIGSRHLGDFEKVSSVRSVGLYVFNGIINFLQGTKITDCASGYRAIRIQKLREWQLLQSQYHTAEMIIEAAKNGARICERPISVQKRSFGQSKKGKDVRYGFFFMRTVVKTWLR